MKDYETFDLGDIKLLSRKILKSAKLAYKTYGTLNKNYDNVIVLPTFYTGTHKRNEGFFGMGRAIDPNKYFIVSINMFGNGLSTSPSNSMSPQDGPRFPNITLWDNISCQQKLLTQKLKVKKIALVTGWSMAGCQAYQWAAQFPDMVKSILPFCASAKTSIHNHVFLEGVKGALIADQNWNNGNYKSPPVAGLKAFGRVYAGWAFSQDFFRERLFKKLGFQTEEELLKDWEKTGYPKYISVTTGKNKQDRILEAAKIVNGAMKITGSVQSLDSEILENVSRRNISSAQIVDMALKSSEIGAQAFSEVILGLPGDTTKKHFSTLKILVDSAFTSIAMYQLMILPGTELGSKTSKEKYKMKTKFRVVPRCYGTYEILGKKISVAEIEEVCVANSTLSFKDYLECRKMNLVIQIFFNDGVFEEILFLLRKLDISAWDWLNKIYENSKKSHFKKFNKLLQDFLDDSEKELWTSYEDLKKFTYKSDNIKKFIKGERGSNLIFKYKSRSYTLDLENISDIAIFTTKQILVERLENKSDLSEFVEDLINYKKCQVQGIFEGVPSIKRKFKFDIPKFITMKDSITKTISLEKFKYKSDIILNFKLSKFQIEQMKFYKNIFGVTLEGISRTLSRVYVKKFFRSTQTEHAMARLDFIDNNSRRLTGELESI